MGIDSVHLIFKNSRTVTHPSHDLPFKYTVRNTSFSSIQ